MPQPRTVTRTQLAILMLTLIAVPIACGLLLYALTPKLGEPPLPALIKFQSEWIGNEEVNRRLVPCIVIKNDSDGELGKLSIGLNKQFYSTGNRILQSGEQTSIPLESFIARNGSVRFPVGQRVIEQVTVFGQLPNGARGVSEYALSEHDDDSMFDKSAGWLAPQHPPQ
ncbi:hypothetical protein VN12_07230 [Pirellula sp. SH-Sr6A]|uniref:hypothetical protein n=1 Tax=Pirellula sp. SH-Sr6A TaxID=1632865 RepID=UPI00078EA586|nr:hypothetical protein [Pirellula sp. SH-Sr6A]AMV31896.1 hypothetical protein VN12_07230 [Pirellula sp. SH-Sr6A]